MQQSTANAGGRSPPRSAGQPPSAKSKKTTGTAQALRPAGNVPRIPLERLLLDAYEFHGLKELGLYFLFFIAFAVFVWFQWSMMGPQFRSSVVESIRNWDTGHKWESSDLKEVESMPDAFGYTIGYLKAALTDTLEQNHSDPSVVLIGDYAEVHLAVITVDLRLDECKTILEKGETSCRNNTWKYKECEISDLARRRNDRVDEFKNTFRWHQREDEINELQAVIVSLNTNDSMKYELNSTTQGFLQRVLDIEKEDASVVMQYASTVKLQMVLTSAIAPDVVMVELVFNSANEVLKRGLKPHLLMLTVAVEHAWWVYVFCVLALTLCFLMMVRELHTWWLCYCQSGRPWMYFWFVWNLIQAGTFLGTTVFLLWFTKFALTRQEACKQYYEPAAEILPHLRSRAKAYTVYLYVGIVLIGVQGFCMVRYMRVHPGLKAFYMVFVLAFDTFKDFAFFVLYMFLVLGLLVFGMFQISGGNKLFVDYGTGLGAIARLQFQLLDFDEFTNLGLGFGAYSGFIYSMYWICVILLVVFVANILLAIFQHAYEKVRERSEYVEDSFPWLVVKRATFNTCKMWHYLKISWQEFTKTENHKYDDLEGEGIPLRAPEDKPKLAHKYLNAILNKYKQTGSTAKPMSTWDLLQARWLVSKKKIVRALMSHYTDYKDLRLVAPREKPFWAGPGNETSESYTRTRSENLSGNIQEVTPDVDPPFLKTKWVTEEELERLLFYVLEKTENKRPKSWLFQWFVAPHYLLRLKSDRIPHVAATIFNVYIHTDAPRRGTEDDDILNEESEEHTATARLEQLEKHVLSLSTKLDEATALLRQIASSSR